jgi:hypothetical protein
MQLQFELPIFDAKAEAPIFSLSQFGRPTEDSFLDYPLLASLDSPGRLAG